MVDDLILEWYEESDDGDGGSLDQFSPSPTHFPDLGAFHRCRYNAPYFAIERSEKRFKIVQGCCNHWDCPKCGIQVAKAHYGRIVVGARAIHETEEMWFITVTCRGKELTVEDAKAHYLEWTSKFLDACYSRAKRAGMAWAYVQVTELQRRGHPHSHILTTFHPSDLFCGTVDKWKTGVNGLLVCNKVPALRSDWLAAQVKKSGLGTEYDISRVQTVEACSRYVAKYMFKKSQFSADFPKRWKRVRYAQSWPKVTRQKSNAFVLLSQSDWRELANAARVLDVEEGDAYETASYYLRGYGLAIHEIKNADAEAGKYHKNKRNTVS